MGVFPTDLAAAAMLASVLVLVLMGFLWCCIAYTMRRILSPKVFISYRRSDAADFVGRLYDSLSAEFRGNVYMDTQSVEPGEDIALNIGLGIHASDIVIPVIGKNWLTAAYPDTGNLRLLDARDYVRREIEFAIDARKIVIPVRANNAAMPPPDALPQLQDRAWLDNLSSTAGLPIRSDSLLEDVKELIKFIRGKGIGRRRFIALNVIMAVLTLALAWAIWQIGRVELFSQDNFATIQQKILQANVLESDQLTQNYEGKWLAWRGTVTSRDIRSNAFLNVDPKGSNGSITVYVFLTKSKSWQLTDLPEIGSDIGFVGRVSRIRRGEKKSELWLAGAVFRPLPAKSSESSNVIAKRDLAWSLTKTVLRQTDLFGLDS